jgi:HK97 family phage major capsid protein
MGKAAQLREDALAKLMEAKAYSETQDMDPERLEALMGEFRDLDAKASKAQTTDETLGTIKDRMEWYAGKATGAPVHFSSVTLDASAGQSRGAAFVASAEYRELVSSGALASDRSSFKSRPFLAAGGGAASDVVQTGTGGPATDLVLPQYLPGIVPLPQRPLTIRDLFSAGTATSDTVSYAQQKYLTSGAAAVAQAVSASTGEKPQSSLGWERKTSPVETIATWMAVTRQTLADAGQVRALIDNQLDLLLRLEEEDQLLNGDGTSPNLSGIYDQVIQELDLTSATSHGDPNLDGVRVGMRMVKTGASRATADAVVVNPIDSADFDLLVDDQGHYRIGDPFAYNANGQPRPIWGLTRVESEAVTQGKALVGAFKMGATVLERQGVTILTADQHADFFVRNLVVVLAEERLGFPVYFPSAFVDVTLKSFDYLS